MPAPLVIWGIIVGVTALLGGGVALGVNRDKLVVALQGKRIAILGEREVGKTTLFKFLSEGWLPLEYNATMVGDKTAAKRFKLKDLDLKLKQSEDVAGGKDHHGEWQASAESSDLLIYLVRSDRLLAGHHATEARVKRDVEEHIKNWVSKKRVAIVGTFADKDPRFADPAKHVEMADAFRALQSVKRMRAALGGDGGGADVTIVLGSLAHDKYARDLVYALFSALLSKK